MYLFANFAPPNVFCEWGKTQYQFQESKLIRIFSKLKNESPYNLPMQKSDLLSLYDTHMRINLRLPGVAFERTPRLVRDLDPASSSGFIDYAALDDSSADAEIDAQIAYYSSLNLPFTWKVYGHDHPADLCRRLASRGFTISEPSTLMLLDLAGSPAVLAPAPLPPQVTRLEGEEAIEAVVRVEETVYGSPRDWLRGYLKHLHAVRPDLLSLFGAVVEGQVVSAGWIIYYEGSPFASILGGATLPDYRSRGFYTALLAVRAREAQKRGTRFLAVDASPMSAPILARHGFIALEQTTYCRWSPPAD